MSMNKLAVVQEPQWYAVYTRSRAEKKLFSWLQQKEVECFLPLKKTLRQRSDRKKWVELPLIPSYLFVRITEKEHFKVLNTPGAVRYVSFGGQPVSIPEEQIFSLNNLVAKKSETLEVHYGEFEKGEWVEVEAGPLKGLRAEVVELRGKQRLLLRLESLGCCVHVEAPNEEVNKAVSKG